MAWPTAPGKAKAIPVDVVIVADSSSGSAKSSLSVSVTSSLILMMMISCTSSPMFCMATMVGPAGTSAGRPPKACSVDVRMSSAKPRFARM